MPGKLFYGGWLGKYPETEVDHWLLSLLMAAADLIWLPDKGLHVMLWDPDSGPCGQWIEGPYSKPNRNDDYSGSSAYWLLKDLEPTSETFKNIFIVDKNLDIEGKPPPPPGYPESPYSSCSKERMTSLKKEGEC